MEQQIQFTTAPDGVSICYATSGSGPPVVKAGNWLTHLEFDIGSPVWRHMWDELSRDHLLVRYDQRGCGLSDWDAEDLSFDSWVSDLESVVAAAGLDRFALLGISQGGPVAIEYAVRHPEMVSHLVLYGSMSRGRLKWGQASPTAQEFEALLTLMREGWGRDHPAYRQIFTSRFIPEGTAEQMEWFNELQRVSASPENAARLYAEIGNIDVQARLPQVTVPTLVLHARGEVAVPFEEGRRLAAVIPNAKFVPLESKNHFLLESEPAWPVFLSEVRHFLSSVAEQPSTSEDVAAAVEAERPDLRQHTSPDGTVTLLFSDIEGSTVMTERLGDLRMQEVLMAHHSIVREQVSAFGGFEVKSMGDGFMLAFSSARRALQCAVPCSGASLLTTLSTLRSLFWCAWACTRERR